MGFNPAEFEQYSINEMADFTLIYADKVDDITEIHAHFSAMLANCHGLKKRIKPGDLFKRRLKHYRKKVKSHYANWKQADLRKLWDEITGKGA